MHKDENLRRDALLRRSKRSLPPPSTKDWDKRVKPAEEVLEERALAGFAVAIFVAALLLTVVTASVYAIAGIIVLDVLHDAGAIDWTLSWVDAFTISLIVLFSRAWWRASYLNTKDSNTKAGK